MAKIKHGICIYTWDQHGNLTGLYTNETGNSAGIICNEIARKKTNNPGLDGDYLCCYIEINSTGNSNRVTSNISIKQTENQNVYDFIWTDDSGGIHFKGKGYIIQSNQVVVNYWE